jgi:hypothetical protein
MHKPPVDTFAETSALYAVLRDDVPEARTIVGDMLNNELGAFLQQVMTLHEIVVTEMAGRVPTRNKRNGH